MVLGKFDSMTIERIVVMGMYRNAEDAMKTMILLKCSNCQYMVSLRLSSR